MTTIEKKIATLEKQWDAALERGDFKTSEIRQKQIIYLSYKLQQVEIDGPDFTGDMKAHLAWIARCS